MFLVRIVSDSPKGLNLHKLAQLFQEISEILSACSDTKLPDGPLLNWKSSEMRRWMKAAGGELGLNRSSLALQT